LTGQSDRFLLPEDEIDLSGLLSFQLYLDRAKKFYAKLVDLLNIGPDFAKRKFGKLLYRPRQDHVDSWHQ